MKTLCIPLRDLHPGDYILTAHLSVTNVQPLGPVVIVDLEDGTATRPLPANSYTDIERSDNAVPRYGH